MKVLVIGAGPAGMMAAIKASENGHDVTILEKNERPGKKLNITGKGRCNISYVGNKEYFLENVVNNPKFMQSSISNFDNVSLIEFVNSCGVRTKQERGNRIFLASDNARELTDALEKELKKLKVKVIYNCQAKEIVIKNNSVVGILNQYSELIKADKIILATGGSSYKSTGSTGDGYELAMKVGHLVEPIRPALVPIILKQKEECMKLRGVTLKNVTLNITQNGKVLDKRFGEMMFTDKGITGPIVLSSSSKINKIIDTENIKISIDLKPALTKEELYKRITRDFEKYINKEFKNSLIDLTISSLIPIIIKRSGIDEQKKVNVITKQEKEKLADTFKNLEFDFEKLEDLNVGIVTSGGINVKEINPKTMESKIINGLYFAGEVIDVDAYTGGFNLQIAFSTGYTAGSNV